jgi:DNA-directed RNA polymerase subunit RPC12/RpoP
MLRGALRLEADGTTTPTDGAACMSSSRVSDQEGLGSEATVCSKCGTEMKEVTSVAPTLHDPGLVAYECPRCGHLTSLLERRQE